MTAPKKSHTSQRIVLVCVAAGFIIFVVAGVVVAFIAQAYVVKPYLIPSSSMEATLTPGERILVDRLAYRSAQPQRGGGGVYRQTVATGETVAFVSRVIGLPGETISIEGEPLREPYAEGITSAQSLERDKPWSFQDPYVVPVKSYFLLSDNREQAADSRFWGPVSREDLIGRYWRTYWGD